MSSIDSLLATYLLTGLAIGFGHCIGMCGPLVISFSLNQKDREGIKLQLFYHAGRILTYALLGAVMGATGSFTMVVANIRGVQIGAMLFAGGLIVVMGLAMGSWMPPVRFFKWNVVPAGYTSRLFSHLSGRNSIVSYFLLGLVLGLLPCGPVYTALLGAARTGMQVTDMSRGLIAGMALMTAFGLGTVPALFFVAKLANTGWLKKRRSIYKIGALLMIGTGLYFIMAALRY